MRSMLATVLLAGLLPAQLVVNPQDSLQAAIDKAPDGGWILCRGGTWNEVQVAGKSLAIVASPRAHLGNTRPLPSLDVTGAAWFYLRGFDVDCVTNIYSHNSGPGKAPGVIRARGCGAVWLEDCKVQGTTHLAQDGVEHGGRAVLLERVAVLALVRCELKASGAFNFYSDYQPPVPNGVAALTAEGCEVWAIASVLYGGHGADVNSLRYWWSLPVGDPRLGGCGGNGAEAKAVYDYGSRLIPGPGGACSLDRRRIGWQPWGAPVAGGWVRSGPSR